LVRVQPGELDPRVVTHVAQAKLARTTCTSTKDKRRNAVNSYLNRVDQIQTRFAPSFAAPRTQASDRRPQAPPPAPSALRPRHGARARGDHPAAVPAGGAARAQGPRAREHFLPEGPGRLHDGARDTGHQLATALRARDRNAVTGLIKRFRFLLSHQPNVSQAQHDAVKSYDNRLVGINRLQGKIQAEHQRLQNLLG